MSNCSLLRNMVGDLAEVFCCYPDFREHQPIHLALHRFGSAAIKSSANTHTQDIITNGHGKQWPGRCDFNESPFAAMLEPVPFLRHLDDFIKEETASTAPTSSSRCCDCQHPVPASTSSASSSSSSSSVCCLSNTLRACQAEDEELREPEQHKRERHSKQSSKLNELLAELLAPAKSEPRPVADKPWWTATFLMANMPKLEDLAWDVEDSPKVIAGMFGFGNECKDRSKAQLDPCMACQLPQKPMLASEFERAHDVRQFGLPKDQDVPFVSACCSLHDCPEVESDSLDHQSWHILPSAQ